MMDTLQQQHGVVALVQQEFEEAILRRLEMRLIDR